MRLHLFKSDLRKGFENLDPSEVKYKHFKRKAQEAISFIGGIGALYLEYNFIDQKNGVNIRAPSKRQVQDDGTYVAGDGPYVIGDAVKVTPCDGDDFDEWFFGTIVDIERSNGDTSFGPDYVVKDMDGKACYLLNDNLQLVRDMEDVCDYHKDGLGWDACSDSYQANPEGCAVGRFLRV